MKSLLSPFTYLGMAILSAATLLLQVTFTRVFSVAQFYHFAFLVVSLALLGFGASGSLLAVSTRLRSEKLSPWYAVGFALSAVLAYIFVNHFAFDSYSIAWDSSQAFLLVANLLGLAVPFIFAGALIGALLSQATERAGHIYAANLFGSAAGAILAPLLIGWMGSERVILLCAVLGTASGIVLSRAQRRRVTLAAILGGALSLGLLIAYPPLFEVQPSPYKALNQFRLNPDASITATHQNAYSRLDVIESPTIHSAQGLSLTYLGDLPPQIGLLIDGSDLQTVSEAAQVESGLLRSLPIAVAYSVRERPTVLSLGSASGMSTLAALANGAEHVTVVEPNELIYNILTGDLRAWAGLADDPRVTLVRDETRSFVGRATERYDIVEIPLTDSYRPISSGAFTLTENYSLTVQAFKTYLSALEENGLLIMSRWLQTPPSECLRTLGVIIEALEGRDPLQHIIAFRSFQLMTFIVKPTPFTASEVEHLLASIQALRYDLVLAPEMPEAMINQYARLETDVYHETFLQLIQSHDRATFYAGYTFDVTPPTDDKPFFFHFFRWEQTPAVIENLGRRWQPFGGSGYFVLLALLVFAFAAAVLFVLAPIPIQKRFRGALRNLGLRNAGRVLGYFVLIGLAYLLVEVSLIQKYILLLGQPTLAIAIVIGVLLFFSGLGSAVSLRVPWRPAMLVLALLLILHTALIDILTPILLPLHPLGRLFITALMLAPVGFLMGVPFPHGVRALERTRDLVPWAWAANGSASVVSAVLAATLSLSLGFMPVLWIGSGLYLLAAIIRFRA